jgi:hypothetical protein
MAVWFMRWLRCANTTQTADGIAITIGNAVVARRPGEKIYFVSRQTTDAASLGDSVLQTRQRAHGLSRGGAIG